jgi:hypothetical protein
MTSGRNGQAPVVFGSPVAQQDRRARNDATMDRGNDQQSQNTEGDRLKGEVCQPHGQDPVGCPP